MVKGSTRGNEKIEKEKDEEEEMALKLYYLVGYCCGQLQLDSIGNSEGLSRTHLRTVQGLGKLGYLFNPS